ncbi:MAG: hypothetical protein KKF56_01090 [Nanoarchaeota archaeon]|nr:hypothetical protein [Nanoarchaeota archaeon]
MDLEKLVVALGISIFLALFLSQTVSFIYKPPISSLSIGASSAGNTLMTYSLVTMVIYGLLGILFIVLGLLFIKLRSIGSGFILGGTYIAAYGSLLGGFGSLLTSLSSGSLFGGSSSGLSTALDIVKIFIYLTCLLLLIFLGYSKVEKEKVPGKYVQNSM